MRSRRRHSARRSPELRSPARRWLPRSHRLLRAAVVAALVLPLAAAGRSVTPAPVPPTLPAIAAGTLDARYTANHRSILEAEQMARRAGNEIRAEHLRGLATTGRRFLTFDGRGGGRAVEVLGDLVTADRIAVLVPGADTTLDTYDRRGGKPYSTPGGGARALRAELERIAPASRIAVVAWLGYDTPETISPEVVTTGRANEGAHALTSFVSALRAVNPSAGVALLCHSYGSTVCGQAAAGLTVSDIAAYGSPGMGAATVSALRTRARIWAGRGSGDWMGDVPHASVSFLGTTVGLGPDPTSASFGARPFTAGSGGHSDYLAPGGPALRNLALVTLGRTAEVSHD